MISNLLVAKLHANSGIPYAVLRHCSSSLRTLCKMYVISACVSVSFHISVLLYLCMYASPLVTAQSNKDLAHCYHWVFTIACALPEWLSTRLRLSADLREWECTFLLSRSEMCGGNRMFCDFKLIFRCLHLNAVNDWQPINCERKGVMWHDFIALSTRRAAMFWLSCRSRRENLGRPERRGLPYSQRLRTKDVIKRLLISRKRCSPILDEGRIWKVPSGRRFLTELLKQKSVIKYTTEIPSRCQWPNCGFTYFELKMRDFSYLLWVTYNARFSFHQR